MGYVRTSRGMRRQRFEIWGYMRGYESVASPRLSHTRIFKSYRTLQWFCLKDPQISQMVPKMMSQDFPRCPTGLFFQGCLLALFSSFFSNTQERSRCSRKSCGKWPSGSHVTLSHLSSARTLSWIGHIQLTWKAVLQMYSLDLRSRNVRHVLKCCLATGSNPQSSKAPTRGDRLRSDIVQSTLSVPQILWRNLKQHAPHCTTLHHASNASGCFWRLWSC